MARSSRNLKLVVFATAMLLPVTAGLAWACTAQPTIVLSTSSITRGPLEVTATSPTSGPVEIRWNSSDGPVLGKGDAGLFKGTIEIPSDAKPGYYYVVAVFKQDAQGSGINGRISEIVEIVNPRLDAAAGQSPVVSPGLWEGFDSAGNLSLSPTQAAPADSRALGSLAAGLGLLAVGVGSLAVGGVVLTRRRRVQSAKS